MDAKASCEWKYLRIFSLIYVVICIAVIRGQQQGLADVNEQADCHQCPASHASVALKVWTTTRRTVCVRTKSCKFWLIMIMMLSGDLERNPGPIHSDHTYSRKTEKVTPRNFGTICAAIGCNNYTMRNKEVSFHSFPKDSQR